MSNTTYTKKPLYVLSVLGDIPVRQDPITFTSSLYPFLVTDSLSIGTPRMLGGFLSTTYYDTENLNLSCPSILSGMLQQVEVYYDNELPDVMFIYNPAILSGALQQVAITYSNELPDVMNVLNPSILSGILQQVAITYSNELPDVMNVLNPSILSGTLV